MIKVMTQRQIPPGFDPRDDTQVARHARYAVDAMASLGGRMHWICTYITDDTLFGVIVFENEDDLAGFQSNAGISGQNIIVHRIARTIDASFAASK
jgi:hypothetical protein